MGKIADAVRGTSLPQQKQTQMLALDTEFSDMEAKVKILEAQNLHLQAQVNPLQREIDRLKNQIKESQDQSSSHSDHLEQVREKILLAVAKTPGANDQQLAHIAGVSDLIATFHLTELKASKMVSVQYIAGSDWAGTSGSATWSIKQPGLNYLVSHGLIA